MGNEVAHQVTHPEIEQLKRENAALRAQGLLLDRFVAMIRSPSKGEMLNACLQQTLDLATELTEADKGSIFILDESGTVTDSILTRQSPVKDKSKLIGSIMDKGLAGWVCRHRTCGIVHDADNDSRWLPLKNQPYTVGSALAVPIIRGEVLFGILTLLHSKKNHFSENLVEAMQATADQIALVLENVKLYVALTKAKEVAEVYAAALDQELEKGRKIQKDFLPGNLPRFSNLEIAAEFVPALQVSGDFYDAFTLPGDLVGVVIGDVSDKGIGAALYMALIRSFIRMFANQCCEETLSLLNTQRIDAAAASKMQLSALKSIEITNDYLAREHAEEGMFATVFFGVVDPMTGTLAYINAGHLPVYILEEHVEPLGLTSTAPAIGLVGGFSFQSKQLDLKPGSFLFGYTDGVTEALSSSGKMYGNSRLKEKILPRVHTSADEIVKRVLEDLLVFVEGVPQYDDITMIAVHWRNKNPIAR
jgi:sigma-B regulation protein RsbU (phosphoserine phosphatase)